MPETKEMYTKVGDGKGCGACGHGEMFDIVFDNEGPLEMAEGISCEDEEFVDDIVAMLNAAYGRGREALPQG